MAMFAKLLLLASMALPLYAQIQSEQIATHARSAQEAQTRNDFPTAVREYQYLVHLLPASAEMRSNLGIALYFNHDLIQAINVFRKATELNGKLVVPHLFTGLARYRLSDPDAAVPELETAVRLNPSDIIAHTWLGYAYGAQSRYEPALKEFQATQKLDPGNIDVWYALGQTHLQIGKEATSQLLTLAPDGGRAWQLAAEQAQLKGDHQEAINDFREALHRRPDLTELSKVIGDLGGHVRVAPQGTASGDGQEDDLYQRAHQAEQEARSAFEHLVQVAPDSYRAHQIMADAFAAQQRNAEAIEVYRAVVKVKPDLPGIHEAIANCLLRLGKQPEALKEFEAELQIQPRSASAHTNVGQLLLTMGENERARALLSKALELDRPPPEIYRLLGKIDMRCKDYHAAVSELTQYLAIRKGDSTGYYLLSRAYKALGDKNRMEQAVTMFEKTSRDVKDRSRAQKQLEARSNSRSEAEESGDPTDVTTQ
jgi:tetratricopeptide (TPR) repeat protein